MGISEFFTGLSFKIVGPMYLISFVTLVYSVWRLYMYFKTDEGKNMRFQGLHVIFIYLKGLHAISIYLMAIFVSCYVGFNDLHTLLFIVNILFCLCLWIVSIVYFGLFVFLYRKESTVNYMGSSHLRHDNSAYH